jgi:hypothetical protein
MNYKSKLLLGAALFGLAAGGAGVGIALAKKPEEALATSGTITYTNASVSSNVITLTKSGTAPSGSSATCYNGYDSATQISSNQSMSYTITGLSNVTFTSLTLSMKSNASSGAGSLSYQADSSTAVTLVDSKDFSDTSWNGAWSSTFVNVTKTLNVTASASFVITIKNTNKSLYCQSISLAWSDSGVSKTLDSISAGSTVPTKTSYTVGDAFDPTGLTITATYTDSSTADVTSSVVWTPTTLATSDTSVTGTYTESGVSKTIIVSGLTVTAAAGLEGYDFVTNFSTYAAAWTTAYGAHSVDSTALKSGLPAATINFTYAAKSSSNVTDRPVFRCNNTTSSTLIFHLTEANKRISSVTVNLYQYTTKTPTVSLYKGSAASGTALDSGVMGTKNVLTTTNLNDTYFTVAGVGSSTTNVQYAISNIVITTVDYSATLTSMAVTTMPSKTIYDQGETLNLAGLVITGTYDDSSTADVTSQCTFAPANGDTLSTIGTTEVIAEIGSVYTSFNVTVTAGPAYAYTLAKADFNVETQMAPDGATSVTACLVKNGASTLGISGDQETWYADYTYSSLITKTLGLPQIESLDNDRGLQFGSADYPFANFSFTSGLFCANQGVRNEYSITRITVDASTASGNNGVATLNVSVNDVAIGSQATLTNTSTIYTFTPTSAVTGHVKLDFANPGTTLGKQAAIYIKAIKIYATAADTELAACYHVAQDLEKLDTCNVTSADWTTFKATSEASAGSTYDDIKSVYASNFSSINLYDYAATGTGVRARTATVTATAKWAAIAAKVAASGALDLKDEGDTTSIAAIASLSILALLGAGYFVLIRRRKEN